MAVDYANLALVAQDLLESNGRAVTLVKLDETPADASKPWRGNATAGEVTTAVTAVLLGYLNSDVDGDIIRRGDQQAFVAELSAPGQELKDYEILRDDEGQEWKIVNVEKVRPGGTTLLYKLQLRK